MAKINYSIPLSETPSFVRGFGLIPQTLQKEYIERACLILGKNGQPCTPKTFHCHKRGEAKTSYKKALRLQKLAAAKKYGVPINKFFDKKS